MKKREFLEKLKTAKDHFRWEITDESKTIVGSLPLDGDCVCFCPITAVQFVLTGEFRAPEDWEAAAREIGLDLSVAHEIVNAADHVHFHKELRDELETILFGPRKKETP